jgi:hypothetical protein
LKEWRGVERLSSVNKASTPQVQVLHETDKNLTRVERRKKWKKWRMKVMYLIKNVVEHVKKKVQQCKERKRINLQ